METQKDRLLSLIERFGMKVAAFEKAIGVSRSTVYHMDTISPTLMEKIKAAYPMVSSVWLMSGYGDMFVSPSSEVTNVYATGGSAASVNGDATVSSSSTDDKKRIQELEAQVTDLKDKLLEAYQRLMEK